MLSTQRPEAEGLLGCYSEHPPRGPAEVREALFIRVPDRMTEPGMTSGSRDEWRRDSVP